MEAQDISTELLEIVKHWGIQQDIDACLPTCLHNVLSEIARRRNHYDPFTPSMEELRKLCGHMPGGTSWTEAYKGLRTEMRRKKIVEWSLKNVDGRMIELKKLCDVVYDKDTSFPIVTLGGEYLKREYNADLDGDPFSWLNHSVAVVECSPDSFTIFDTYNFDGGSPVRKIGKNTFEEYWTCGDPKKGMMWFEKKSLTLEGFQKGDADE